MRRICKCVFVLSAFVCALSGAAQEPRQNGDASAPLLPLHWRVPVLNNPGDERIAQELSEQFAKEKVPAIPQFRAYAAGDFALMRTPERAMGVDFRAGKRRWEYPWFNSPFETNAASSIRPSSPKADELRQRLWDDATFALLTVSGDSLFVLDKLEPLAIDSRAERTVIGIGGRRVVSDTPPSNELVALSIPTHGKIRWIVGGETGGDDPALADYFFLTSGTMHDGRLYVVGERENKLQLLAIDPETGRLDWSVALMTFADDDPLRWNPLRRLAGVAPVAVGKRLVCPTVHGRIVAVDIDDRKLAWSKSYEITPVPAVARFRRIAADRPVPQHGEHWLDNAVLPAGDFAIVTPIDSSRLFCLDAAAGKLQWELERGDRLFAAVHNDVCLLVGQHSVSARTARGGMPLWEDRRIEYTRRGSAVSGRGAFDGHDYLLPADKELLALDLQSGKVSVVARSEFPLGNLTIHGDWLLSHGADSLLKFAR